MRVRQGTPLWSRDRNRGDWVGRLSARRTVRGGRFWLSPGAQPLRLARDLRLTIQKCFQSATHEEVVREGHTAPPRRRPPALRHLMAPSAFSRSTSLISPKFQHTMRKPIHFRSAYAPSPSPSTHRSPSPEDIPSLGLSESRLDETEATRAMLHKWDLMMGPPSDVDHDRGRRRGRARSMPARSKSRVRLWEEERDRGSRERDLRARQTGGELLDSDAEDRVLERLRRWPSSDEDRTGSASDDEERFSGHFITSDGVGMSMQVGVSSVDSLVFPASSDLDDDGWQPPPRHRESPRSSSLARPKIAPCFRRSTPSSLRCRRSRPQYPSATTTPILPCDTRPLALVQAKTLIPH